MVTKTQLALLLVTCVVMSLLFEPAVSQKDALRWGKRDSGVPEEYAPINPNARRRQYDNQEDYYSKSTSLLDGC